MQYAAEMGHNEHAKFCEDWLRQSNVKMGGFADKQTVRSSDKLSCRIILKNRPNLVPTTIKYPTTEEMQRV
jgi:hypothetical protein